MKPNQKSRAARQRTRQLDQVLAGAQVPNRPPGGWVSAVRKTLGMSETQLARRIGIARQSVNQLEKNEVRDAATLAGIKRAADALGCDLRYVLVPRESLQQTVADQAVRRARQKLGRVNQSQALEVSALAADSFADAVSDLAKELEVQRPSDLWNE